MKNLRVLTLLTSLLLASMAQAQTGTLADGPQPAHAVVETLLATSPRALNSSATDAQLIPASPSESTQSSPAGIPSTQTPNQSIQQPSENKLITQAAPFPRFPRGPMASARGRAYPSAFAPRPPMLSPLGALIGFGTGAALAAAGSQDQTTRGRVAAGLIGGTLCALIGGAIGRSFSLVTSHNYRDWDDAQARKHHKVVPRPIEPDVDASSAPTPAPSTGTL